MLAAAAEPSVFLRAAGGLGGVVPVLGELDSGLRPYAVAVRMALQFLQRRRRAERQHLRQPDPVSGHRHFLVEAQGNARAAVEPVVAGTVAARGCVVAAYFGLCRPADVSFGFCAVHRHLRVDGAGLGTRMAAAELVSVFSLRILSSPDGAPECCSVSTTTAP